MRVFLIGFMASGKSTVGKKLANKIALPFIDLDDYIEEKYNTTIRELMNDSGQAVFREIERDSLNSVIKENKSVIISTGGGTPCYFDNMERMKLSGNTIYIELDIPTIVDRLMHSKKERPLVLGKTKEELIVYAKDLLEKRDAFYKQAKYIVNGRSLKLKDLVSLIE